MADRIKFQEKLNGIWDMAKSQGGRISLEEVEIYFEEDHLSEEQMNLVCEYLLSQKMAVTGYIQTKGRVKDRGEEQEGERLSSEEQSGSDVGAFGRRGTYGLLSSKSGGGSRETASCRCFYRRYDSGGKYQPDACIKRNCEWV